MHTTTFPDFRRFPKTTDRSSTNHHNTDFRTPEEDEMGRVVSDILIHDGKAIYWEDSIIVGKPRVAIAICVLLQFFNLPLDTRHSALNFLAVLLMNI